MRANLFCNAFFITLCSARQLELRLSLPHDFGRISIIEKYFHRGRSFAWTLGRSDARGAQAGSAKVTFALPAYAPITRCQNHVLPAMEHYKQKQENQIRFVESENIKKHISKHSSWRAEPKIHTLDPSKPT